jgi:DNA-binding NarL/FixJ family response regulator
MNKPVIYIFSKHPVAYEAFRAALISGSASHFEILPAPSKAAANASISILDACSLENWAELISKWTAAGSRCIAVMSQEAAGHKEQVKALYLGIRGIVIVSPSLDKELPAAVQSVSQGNLWINRNALDEYVKQTSLLSSSLQHVVRRFTAREEQIAKLLLQGFSNKQISLLLDISARTVKFHVANILQKSNMKSREGFFKLVKSA